MAMSEVPKVIGHKVCDEPLVFAMSRQAYFKLEELRSNFYMGNRRTFCPEVIIWNSKESIELTNVSVASKSLNTSDIGEFVGCLLVELNYDTLHGSFNTFPTIVMWP